jgi:hypothetical protein
MRAPRRARGLLSRAGMIALLGLSTGTTGYACFRYIALLANVRPYMGWYWPLAVAAGIAVAVGLPWAFVRKARSSSGRWQGLAVTGYVLALGVGMPYYWGVRFNAPPVGVPVALPQPPLWFALMIAGLSAVALTIAAIALLLLVALVEAIAPGLVAGWLRARGIRRASAPRKPGPFVSRNLSRVQCETSTANVPSCRQVLTACVPSANWPSWTRRRPWRTFGCRPATGWRNCEATTVSEGSALTPRCAWLASSEPPNATGHGDRELERPVTLSVRAGPRFWRSLARRSRSRGIEVERYSGSSTGRAGRSRTCTQHGGKCG